MEFIELSTAQTKSIVSVFPNTAIGQQLKFHTKDSITSMAKASESGAKEATMKSAYSSVFASQIENKFVIKVAASKYRQVKHKTQDLQRFLTFYYPETAQTNPTL